MRESTALREFTREIIRRGLTDLFVDLEQCPNMDSTFMGTLAAAALWMRELARGGVVHVVNASERNAESLQTLGLDLLFDMGGTAPESRGTGVELTGEVNREERARTVLEAHEALIEAEPKNRGRFKDVIEFLKENLGAER